MKEAKEYITGETLDGIHYCVPVGVWSLSEILMWGWRIQPAPKDFFKVLWGWMRY